MQIISNYYDELNYRKQGGCFQPEEDGFAKDAQSINIVFQEIFLLKKLLQTKPQVKGININNYDLCYTVSNNLTEEEKYKISIDLFHAFYPIELKTQNGKQPQM